MRTLPIKAVLFDLDDTLYYERDFFRSGFAAVAPLLAARGYGTPEFVAERLWYFHAQEGRAGVFQKLAIELGFPSEWVSDLVRVFRSHDPAIELAVDSREMLPRLRAHFKLGCVTDGWAHVQRAKLASLRVEQLLDAVVVADDYGREKWKPAAFPLLKCCELLDVWPAEAVFIGDNPARDMASARNAGLLSVRIRRPGAYFADQEPASNGLRADREIVSLYEIEDALNRLQPNQQTHKRHAVPPRAS